MMLSTKRTKKVFILLVAMATCTCLFAQQTFKYRVPLKKPDSSGFYKITLSPELMAKSQTGLNDIRLANERGQFMPYLFGDQLPVSNNISFIVFPQVNLPAKADTATTFIAENKRRLSVGQLTLKLRNTTVERRVNLSGSDDGSHWYAIDENISLNRASLSDKTGVYEQTLNFPISTYRYYKIRVNNQHKEPIALVQAGIYSNKVNHTQYAKIPPPRFLQKDTDKTSRIILGFTDTFPIGILHFEIPFPKYFKRKIIIYADKGKNRVIVTTTDLSSITNGDIFVSTKAKTIKADIFNEDNQPLMIKSITAYQQVKTIVGYLERGNQYYLLSGDPTAKAPNYDLKFFADSLQTHLSDINTEEIQANPLFKSKTIAKSTPAWIIWIPITIVVMVLLYLTIQMMGQVNKKNQDPS